MRSCVRLREPPPKSEGQGGLRKTTITLNSLAHRTTWLRSDLAVAQAIANATGNRTRELRVNVIMGASWSEVMRETS